MVTGRSRSCRTAGTSGRRAGSPDGRYIAALEDREQGIPSWSPDSRLLVFGEVPKVFGHSTGEVIQTYDQAVAVDRVNNPTWSRDGRSICYDTEGDVRMLRRVSIPDGRVDDLVNLVLFPTTVSWWSGLSLEGSPLLLRSIGAPQVYALDLERH